MLGYGLSDFTVENSPDIRVFSFLSFSRLPDNMMCQNFSLLNSQSFPGAAPCRIKV